MLFQRRSLGRRLEILEADFALYGLRSEVLCICVSLLGIEHLCLLPEGEASAARLLKQKEEKKRTDLS